MFAVLLATGLAAGSVRSVAAQTAGAGGQAGPGPAAAPSQPQAGTEGADGQNGQAPAQAGEARPPGDEAQPAGDATLTTVPGSKALGMSILGNQEAPTSLVIVPWKTSELGKTPGISPLLDDSRQPVDRDVFMRALRYHELRSGAAPGDGSTAGGRENAAGSGAAQSTAAHRR
jgi:hypothetical protein